MLQYVKLEVEKLFMIKNGLDFVRNSVKKLKVICPWFVKVNTYKLNHTNTNLNQ